MSSPPQGKASPRSQKSASPPAASTAGGLIAPSLWTDQGMPEEEDGDSLRAGSVASSTESITSSILEYRTVNGRTYHSDRTDAKYWGANDATIIDMMDIQHHVWTLMLEHKMNLAPLPENVGKVLDVGTGSGLWAIDFGDMHPESVVIGTDISPIQPTWTPPNVSFQIEDFTQEWTFPDDSFDFIHFRWLTGSVPDWTETLRQAYRCLKPGGWVEVVEGDAAFRCDDDSMDGKPALLQWSRFFIEGGKKMGNTANFLAVEEKEITNAMKAAGFPDVTEIMMKLPIGGWAKDKRLKDIGEYQQAALESDVEGFIGFSAHLLGWTDMEIKVFAAHLRKEMRSKGLHCYYHAADIYAQKPLE